MSTGDVYKHITLLDSNNNPIPDVFLELPQELWDPTGTRLTIFFHPGRVKQGLVPNQEMGPTLIVNNSYTLRIDTGLIDANGNNLAETFIKHFTATPADQQQPNPASWQVSGPLHHTNEPLTITFTQPLDHAMLLRVIQILDPQLKPIAGSIEIAEQETQFLFTPDQPWQPGNHTIRISNTLEDPSGNNIAERFELPAAEATNKATQHGHTDLHFSITD